MLYASTFKTSDIKLHLYSWSPPIQYLVDKNYNEILTEHGAVCENLDSNREILDRLPRQNNDPVCDILREIIKTVRP